MTRHKNLRLLPMGLEYPDHGKYTHLNASPRYWECSRPGCGYGNEGHRGHCWGCEYWGGLKSRWTRYSQLEQS